MPCPRPKPFEDGDENAKSETARQRGVRNVDGDRGDSCRFAPDEAWTILLSCFASIGIGSGQETGDCICLKLTRKRTHQLGSPWRPLKILCRRRSSACFAECHIQCCCVMIQMSSLHVFVLPRPPLSSCRIVAVILRYYIEAAIFFSWTEPMNGIYLNRLGWSHLDLYSCLLGCVF